MPLGPQPPYYEAVSNTHDYDGKKEEKYCGQSVVDGLRRMMYHVGGRVDNMGPGIVTPNLK